MFADSSFDPGGAGCGGMRGGESQASFPQRLHGAWVVYRGTSFQKSASEENAPNPTSAFSCCEGNRTDRILHRLLILKQTPTDRILWFTKEFIKYRPTGFFVCQESCGPHSA